MNYTRISKEEYYNLPIIELFSGEYKYNRCYATIVVENIMYKFAWESDLILPIIKELPSEAVIISVDHSFCIISTKDNVVLRWPLTTNIVDVFFSDIWCVGICEMNVLAIKLADKFNCYKEYFVDDIISDYQMGRNGIIELKLLDNSTKVIDLYDDHPLNELG